MCESRPKRVIFNLKHSFRVIFLLKQSSALLNLIFSSLLEVGAIQLAGLKCTQLSQLRVHIVVLKDSGRLISWRKQFFILIALRSSYLCVPSLFSSIENNALALFLDENNGLQCVLYRNSFRKVFIFQSLSIGIAGIFIDGICFKRAFLEIQSIFIGLMKQLTSPIFHYLGC